MKTMSGSSGGSSRITISSSSKTAETALGLMAFFYLAGVVEGGKSGLCSEVRLALPFCFGVFGGFEYFNDFHGFVSLIQFKI